MKTTQVKTRAETEDIPKAENNTGIENHKKAAEHFQAAAKNHLAAAKHHEEGHHDKAAKCTVNAHGHSCLGNEAQKKDVKYHASL